MILAAGLLVLVGLGLFVGGILTGMTALYWGCVAACVIAAVLLFLARRTIPADPAKAPAASAPATGTTAAPGTTAGPARTTAETPGAGATDAAPAGAAGATAASLAEPVGGQPADGARELEDPPIEEVEVTDLLLVVEDVELGGEAVAELLQDQ